MDVWVFSDESGTFDNKHYDLQEVLLKELRDVTSSYSVPLFPKTDKVSLKFCKSDQHPLVRGADIVANRVYSIFRPDSTFEKDINGEFVSLTFLP